MTAFNVHDVQQEILSGIRAGQEAMVGAVKTCVETVRAVAQKLPAQKLPAPKLPAPKLPVPGVPVPSVPFADRLPRPEGVVASAYDFAEALLASQRKFAEELLVMLSGGKEDAEDKAA